MGMGEAIYDLLDGVTTRTYPNKAPQGTVLPFLVYTVVLTSPNDTKDGVSDLDVIRIQVSVFSNTYANAQTLAGSVRTALDRYSGTIQSVVIDSINFEGETDLYDEEAQVHHKALDFSIREKR